MMDRRELREGMQIFISRICLSTPQVQVSDMPIIGIIEKICPCETQYLAHLNTVRIRAGTAKFTFMDDALAEVSSPYERGAVVNSSGSMVQEQPLSVDKVRAGMLVRHVRYGVGEIVEHKGSLINYWDAPPTVNVKFSTFNAVVNLFTLNIVSNTNQSTNGKTSESGQENGQESYQRSQRTQSTESSEGSIIKVRRPAAIICRGQATGGAEVRSKRKGASVRSGPV